MMLLRMTLAARWLLDGSQMADEDRDGDDDEHDDDDKIALHSPSMAQDRIQDAQHSPKMSQDGFSQPPQKHNETPRGSRGERQRAEVHGPRQTAATSSQQPAATYCINWRPEKNSQQPADSSQ